MTCLFLIRIWGKLVIRSLGFPGGSAGKESTCNVGDLGSIPGSGRSPREGNGYPLQYSGLEISMACIVHGVTKSRTQLSNFTSLHKTSKGDTLRPPSDVYVRSVLCPFSYFDTATQKLLSDQAWSLVPKLHLLLLRSQN